MVDTLGLGPSAERHESSSLSLPTKKELKGFFGGYKRTAQSADQGFFGGIAREFRIFGALARTVFSPRRRYEIRSNFDS